MHAFGTKWSGRGTSGNFKQAPQYKHCDHKHNHHSTENNLFPRSLMSSPPRFLTGDWPQASLTPMGSNIPIFLLQFRVAINHARLS